jgi:hypothetical protein
MPNINLDVVGSTLLDFGIYRIGGQGLNKALTA